MKTELLGWLSSLLLVLTIGRQVYRQWRSGHSEGVSIWLFVGQMAASTGFTIYSMLVHNWVFVVTNAMMLIFALAGFAIVKSHRRRTRRGASPPRAQRTPSMRLDVAGATARRNPVRDPEPAR